MKQDYTLDELQTEMTALAQLFDSVTLLYDLQNEEYHYRT